VLLAVALLLTVPGAALAHAELDESSPADGEVVEGTPAEITADFTESLAANSTFELFDAADVLVARGAIDPENDARMAIDPPDLAPGEYKIEWRAFASDGHQELGTYTFTVTAAPTPTPPPPTPSAQVSAAPTAAPSSPPPGTESPNPSAGPDTEPTAGTGDVLIPILAAVVLIAVLGGYLLTRRRQTPRP
jgi:hypothetical protein